MFSDLCDRSEGDGSGMAFFVVEFGESCQLLVKKIDSNGETAEGNKQRS